MELDDLLQRYFGTSNLSEASPSVQEAGVDRLRVDLGLETDRAKRFALWSLLYMLGHAPDLDVAFNDDSDRQSARNLMDLLAASEPRRVCRRLQLLRRWSDDKQDNEQVCA